MNVSAFDVFSAAEDPAHKSDDGSAERGNARRHNLPDHGGRPADNVPMGEEREGGFQ
jgi:hypothetical protein